MRGRRIREFNLWQVSQISPRQRLGICVNAPAARRGIASGFHAELVRSLLYGFLSGELHVAAIRLFYCIDAPDLTNANRQIPSVFPRLHSVRSFVRYIFVLFPTNNGQIHRGSIFDR